MMIEGGISCIRDPFVLVEEDAFYLYGSDVSKGDWDKIEWCCYKNSGDIFDKNWRKIENFAILLKSAKSDFWSPEVHKYGGSYYLFATYLSSLTGRHGCTILKSDSPEGPFVEITNGQITPNNIDAIDGTFYIDECGTPWMVYVHEWTCTEDKIGRMCAAKLSEDLTHFVSEPVELFRADHPIWNPGQVTDGCFMYKTKEGDLLMLWSNNEAMGEGFGYCVAVAKSESGKIDGKWIHEDKPIFSRHITGGADGGHGMIFENRDGKKYMAIHSPNLPEQGDCEKAFFIPMEEKNGKLYVID